MQHIRDFQNAFRNNCSAAHFQIQLFFTHRTVLQLDLYFLFDCYNKGDDRPLEKAGENYHLTVQLNAVAVEGPVGF